MIRWTQICLFLLLMLPFGTALGQNLATEKPVAVDSLYREDQFYIGVTYNLSLNRPPGVNLRGLSAGIHFGYLRDMPVNKERTLALAIGGGFSFDFYGNNMFIGETPDNETIFTAIDEEEVNFERNRFTTAQIQIPIEFRWRSSTATRVNFWRVYGGVRVGYVYWYKANFKQSGNDVVQTDIPEYDRLRLGATLSFGNGKINFFGYYGLNPFFKNATTTNGDPVELQDLKLGLMFYIL